MKNITKKWILKQATESLYIIALVSLITVYALQNYTVQPIITTEQPTQLKEILQEDNIRNLYEKYENNIRYTLNACGKTNDSNSTRTGCNSMRDIRIETNSSRNLRWTLVHEIAHTIYFDMTYPERREWKNITRQENPITEYALTNEQEFFAETVAAYYHNRTSKYANDEGKLYDKYQDNNLTWEQAEFTARILKEQDIILL